MNTLALLPANKLFNFAPIFSNVSEYLSDSQTCQCKEFKFFAMNHMARLTLEI